MIVKTKEAKRGMGLLTAHENTENANAKLTPRVSSSIRGRGPRTSELFSKRKPPAIRVSGSSGSRNRSDVLAISISPCGRDIWRMGYMATSRRKFVALGIWIGVYTDEIQFGGEWRHCCDLPNVSEAEQMQKQGMFTNGTYISTAFPVLPTLE